MSIKKKRAADASQKKPAFDVFQNELARLGMGLPNHMSSTSYPLTRLTRDYNLLSALYRNNWIIKKIINTVPDDMCKNWFSITADLTPEQTDRIKKVEEKTKVQEKMTEALYWGRLFGGAAAIMVISGHEDILDQPLKLEDVGPNSFKGLMVVDRWSGIFPSLEIIEDFNDPDFGLPEFYEVQDANTKKSIQKIHHSRVIRCVGRKLPFWESQAEIHWGASEVEHVFEEVTKRDNTSWNIAALIFQANLLVNKVQGMDQMMAMGDIEAQQQMYQIKAAQNQMRSSQGMMIIGDQEELTSLQYSFSGINEVYQSFMHDVSGACEIPVTRLFGRSPAGMNATGESDEQSYYDMVAQQQNTVLRPRVSKLYPVIFMSEFGVVPKDLGYKFNPIKTPSDNDIADLVAKKVQAIREAYEAGIITHKCALSELHELSLTTNMFTSISDENIEAADDSYSNPGEFGGELPVTEEEGLSTPPKAPLSGQSSPAPQQLPVKGGLTGELVS